MANAAPVLDFVGREIKVGDTLVYPVRQGSRMWLSRISVRQVIAGPEPTIHGYNNEGRKITIHKVSNAVVVQLPSA